MPDVNDVIISCLLSLKTGVYGITMFVYICVWMNQVNHKMQYDHSTWG